MLGTKGKSFAAIGLAALLLTTSGPHVGAQPAETTQRLKVVSFNIQFLGLSAIRDNRGLAELMAPYDLVFVQELVAPPYPGAFPDGEAFRPDPESAVFFDEMARLGFKYVLSPEDTGSGDRIHLNSSATEWYVAFYRPETVAPAEDLFTGFLAEDRSNHDDYERVPYAFGFRAQSEDLVFISVHLQPGAERTSRARRKHEIAAISSWIRARPGGERDYVILGDMNIEDCVELRDAMPAGYASLNGTCVPTNTNLNGPKPYDHVMIDQTHTVREIPFRFTVINLIDTFRARWNPADGPYPGGPPYDHNRFRQRYSDHHPVAFEVQIDGSDDDTLDSPEAGERG